MTTPTLPTIELEKPTAEQITNHFSAMTDSVNLIAELKAKASLDEEEQASLERNKEHLRIMLAKDFIAEDTRDKSAFVNASK